MSSISSQKLPDFFPRAPKACSVPAEAFFTCFSEKSVKENAEDTQAGVRGLSACLESKALYEKCMISIGNIATMGLDYVSDVAEATVVQYQDENSVVFDTYTSYIFRENIGYLHTASLSSLVPATHYNYRIGDGSDDGVWTEWFQFVTGPYVHTARDFSRKGDTNDATVGGGVAAIYADLGMYNGLSTERLLTEAAEGVYDYGIHIGDISYDLFSSDSANGNDYMEMMSPIFKQYPINVGEGNHEKGDNFTEYNLRFKAIEKLAGANSGSDSNHYYSFDVGLIHFVMVSTEVYQYPEQAATGSHPFSSREQLRWLEKDLRKANSKHQRQRVPWVVLMGHRPWYTMSGHDYNQFDSLACKFAVDLYLTGHVHNYQRWLPARITPLTDNHTIASKFIPATIPSAVDVECSSEDRHTYTEPKYPATIVTGSAGCHSPEPRAMCPAMLAASKLLLKDSLADCSAAYGFGHLQAVNSTHLYWEFVQSHKAASVFDDVAAAFTPKDAGAEAAADKNKDGDGDDHWSDIRDAYEDLVVEQAKVQDHAVTAAEAIDSFMASVESTQTSWLAEQEKIDSQMMQLLLQNQQVRLSMGGASDKKGVRGSRLVRDHLWIVQTTRDGSRDYC